MTTAAKIEEALRLLNEAHAALDSDDHASEERSAQNTLTSAIYFARAASRRVQSALRNEARRQRTTREPI